MATTDDYNLDDREFEPKTSVCPFCGVGCTLTYEPKSGKSTGEGGPVNAKGEICPKGAAAFEMVDNDDRLTSPLVREGGELVPASWGEAFDRIEDEFGQVLDDYGPEALGFFSSSSCTNEENYLLQKIARVLGTNSVDNCARLCHSSTVAALSDRFGAGAMTNTLDDITEGDVFLATGANPAEQHPVIFRSYLLPAIRDGTTFIHIDPRENATTEAADFHLPVKPGHDIPLLNAMAKVVLEGDLVDEGFVEERVDNFDVYEEFLADVDVEENADLAGVDPDDLREAARAFGEADRAAAFSGMGMSQHQSGTDNVHALINLVVLTGNVGKRGTGVNPLRGQNNVQGAGDVGALPDVLPGYESVTDPEARERVGDVWGVEPPAEPGLTEVEVTHGMGEDIHAAYVFAENPAVSEPHLSKVREKLDSIDFLVVHDIFLSETAEHADVVLPGSAWAEKSGTFTNTDRQVQRVRPMTDSPPGEARLDLEILAEFGNRVADYEFADDPKTVFDEMTRINPLYAGINFDDVSDGSVRWPYPEGADAGRQVLHDEMFANGERTTDLHLVDHVAPADEVGEDQLVLTTGRVLQHFNSGAVTRQSGTLMKLRNENALQIHPQNAADRGIEDGDTVVVENDRGRTQVTAEVTPAIRPDTVFMTFHCADPLVNDLTGDHLDPVAGIPEYKHTSVHVRVVPDETAD
ncbi:MAG: formate dehydrogenase alpha subunit [Halobacteriales archaeon]|jgi:formate dehydrogenase alpha subunit